MDRVVFLENIVLIIITNHLEKLDNALIQDGQVNLKVKFDLPQKEELKNLFIQIYTYKVRTLLALEASALPFRDNTFPQSSLFKITEIKTGAIKHINITPTILHVIAEKFAMFLPKNTFSATGI